MDATENHVQELRRIGWPANAALPEPGRDSRIVRVVAQHRNGYRVHDGRQEFSAQPAPRFLRRNSEPTQRPAVGDFVVLTSGTPPLIEQVLPRRTVLSRLAAGERQARQIIATNVDTVLVLMGLDNDFNPRRVERYLALVQGSGAQAVVVLTKRDKVDASMLAEARQQLDPILSGTEWHAVNAKDTASVAPLIGHLGSGRTAVLVGSSGAGKSTLTNTLLGRERQATADVREHDSRGRHTTTHRSLLALPSGGCLIDTPGMREIKLTGEEDLGEAGFADIESLALQCRFGDCAHASEPGCAIRAAIRDGSLDPQRWQSYLKLRDEQSALSDAVEDRLQRKARARVANKTPGRRLPDKDRWQ